MDYVTIQALAAQVVGKLLLRTDPDNLAAMELQTRLLSHVPRVTDAIYVFAETRENQVSPLTTAARNWNNQRCMRVLACDGETEHGAAGFRFCRDALLQSIPAGAIVPLTMPHHIGVNTLSEAEHLVRFCQRNGWQSVSVSAAPFHHLRAYMTTVSVALRDSPSLRVYSAPGDPLEWHETVRHSQGILTGKRRELLAAEYAAIARYRKKGDLLSFREVIAYLDTLP